VIVESDGLLTLPRGTLIDRDEGKALAGLNVIRASGIASGALTFVLVEVLSRISGKGSSSSTARQ